MVRVSQLQRQGGDLVADEGEPRGCRSVSVPSIELEVLGAPVA